MKYINVGAKLRDGIRIPTKKALTVLLRDSPSEVLFDPTSMFDAQDEICADDLPTDARLSVVGPDPYTNRRWYATVERTNAGPRVISLNERSKKA